jgi:hypothetical protein
MEKLVPLTGQLNEANPAVLVTLVCIVALLAMAECVRQLCKVLTKKGGED